MLELRRLREAQGLTHQEMATLLGISRSFYEKVERGERAISGNFIRKLKDKFPMLDVNVFFLPNKNT